MMNVTSLYDGIYSTSTIITTSEKLVKVIKNDNDKTPDHVTYLNALNGTILTLTGNMSQPEPATPEVIGLLSLLFIVIGFIGILGNGLVIVVILVDRKMRNSVTNVFIMNLAVADLLIMLFGIPEIVQFMLNRGWLIGEPVCKINRFVLVVSLYVSILSLVTVCIER